MLPIKFFLALIIVALFGTIFVLFSERLIPPKTATDSNSLISAGDDPVELAIVEVDEIVSATAEPAESQVSSQIDGSLLLESHCSKCHVTQGLKQLKKSRSEWEVTLAQMEALGAHLNDAEKVILIDYLASADNP